MTVPRWRIVAASSGDVESVRATLAAHPLEHLSLRVEPAGSGVHVTGEVIAAAPRHAERYIVQVLGRALGRPVSTVSTTLVGDS